MSLDLLLFLLLVLQQLTIIVRIIVSSDNNTDTTYSYSCRCSYSSASSSYSSSFAYCYYWLLQLLLQLLLTATATSTADAGISTLVPVAQQRPRRTAHWRFRPAGNDAHCCKPNISQQFNRQIPLCQMFQDLKRTDYISLLDNRQISKSDLSIGYSKTESACAQTTPAGCVNHGLILKMFCVLRGSEVELLK